MAQQRQHIILTSHFMHVIAELQRIHQTDGGAKIWRTFPSTENIKGITVDGLRKICELRGEI